MKAIHRKTLWVHTLFSFSLCALIGVIIWLKGDLPTIILGAVIALYVIGNTVIHIKRDDFKQDTIVEYVLLAIAVFIVLASALR